MFEPTLLNNHSKQTVEQLVTASNSKHPQNITKTEAHVHQCHREHVRQRTTAAVPVSSDMLLTASAAWS